MAIIDAGLWYWLVLCLVLSVIIGFNAFRWMVSDKLILAFSVQILAGVSWLLFLVSLAINVVKYSLK